jgi:hypothetical protein
MYRNELWQKLKSTGNFNEISYRILFFFRLLAPHAFIVGYKEAFIDKKNKV